MGLKVKLSVLKPVLIVILLAVALRAWAVALLPQDYDEPTYLQAAFDYASYLKVGNFNAVIDYRGVNEHPAFVKLLYSGVLLLLGKAASWQVGFFACRIVSAIFGVLAVSFVAVVIGPFAAGLLAVHTLAIKYTSQVYLEAIPSAMMVAAILVFLRVDKRKANKWFWWSAVFLGITAASKYSYVPITLIVILYLAILEKKLDFRDLFFYALVAGATFFALDITLWHQPFQRLYESLAFHFAYTQGADVAEAAYPWYQPLVWIFTSAPAQWHPNVFFYFGFDGLISILALAGVVHEWRHRRWLVIWVGCGTLLLLIWPTKWPQYVLSITPALCIMAAESCRIAYRWAQAQESYWNYLEEMIPKPSRAFWILLGVVVVFIAVVYVSSAARLAIGKIGWSHLTDQNSLLPGNTIYDLQPLRNGAMLIATSNGAAIWTKSGTTDQPDQWVVYTTTNSGLTSNQVLAVAQDTSGNLWFGTADGVSTFDGQHWKSYHSADLQSQSEEIISLAAGDNGQVVAGTSQGASLWNGSQWTALVPLANQPVFALAARASDYWFGTFTGVYQLDTKQNGWTFYPTSTAVDALAFDSQGKLWAGTEGSGLASLDGNNWIYYSRSNSGILLNHVNCLFEIKPGTWWLGMPLSTEAGGEVESFDGQAWNSYLTTNSGVSGAEPVAVSELGDEIWIGTRTQGIDLYQIGR